MKIIQNNPYRIAGILSNSSARELQRQKGRIKAFVKVGREITSEFDFDFLNSIERTEQNIEKAFSNIEQNQDKVNNSLFWFLKASPFDETAISYLIKGDSEKAKEIWGKVTNGKEVNSKNFSAFNNIGTLKLLSKSEFEIKEGIKAKMKLIESGYFENFVHTVADQTFTIDNKKQTEKLIDELLTQFKNKYSSADTLDLFSNCNGSTQKYLSKKFTEEPIHNIESNIESVKRKRKDNKSDAYSFGLKLFANAKNDLSLLKSLLGTSDLKYKMVADNLAKEVMQCGIDYFQEWKESKDPSKDSLKLLKYAKSITVGTQTKDRVKSNIEGIGDYGISKSLEPTIIKINKYLNKSNSNDINILMLEGVFCEGYLAILYLKHTLGSFNFSHQRISVLKIGLEQLIVKNINESESDYIHYFIDSSIELLEFINEKLPSNIESTQRVTKTIQSLIDLLDKILKNNHDFTLIEFQMSIDLKRALGKSKLILHKLINDGKYSKNNLLKDIERIELQLNDLIKIEISESELIINGKLNSRGLGIWSSSNIVGKYETKVRELSVINEWKLFRTSNRKEKQIKGKMNEIKELLKRLKTKQTEEIKELKKSIKHKKKLIIIYENNL